jgi:hypothetical protein
VPNGLVGVRYQLVPSMFQGEAMCNLVPISPQPKHFSFELRLRVSPRVNSTYFERCTSMTPTPTDRIDAMAKRFDDGTTEREKQIRKTKKYQHALAIQLTTVQFVNGIFGIARVIEILFKTGSDVWFVVVVVVVVGDRPTTNRPTTHDRGTTTTGQTRATGSACVVLCVSR